VARCLIVGCGCRGLSLTAALRRDGHAVRATTRDPARVAELRAAGAEPFVGDPDRVATLSRALDHVGVLCLLLGSATGTADQLRALHTTRLSMLLGAGAGVVATACERSLIPHVLLTADPGEHEAWTPAAADAVQRALLAYGADAG
jgi:uncharacterized protein YbjT (DUF2867 family)